MLSKKHRERSQQTVYGSVQQTDRRWSTSATASADRREVLDEHLAHTRRPVVSFIFKVPIERIDGAPMMSFGLTTRRFVDAARTDKKIVL